MKVPPPFQVGKLLQNRDTNFLRCSWINRRFINDGSTSLHILANRLTCASKRSKIRLVCGIYWSRDRDDDEICPFECRRIVCYGKVTCSPQGFFGNLAGGVDVSAITFKFH